MSGAVAHPVALKRIAKRVLAPAIYSGASKWKRKILALLELARLDLDLRRVTDVAKKCCGVFPRECPICEFSGYFLAAGDPPRWDAQCPNCGSLERHRLFFLYLREWGDAGERLSVLHFAPERCLEPALSRRVGNYATADLTACRADYVVDIEDMPFPDESFDIVICNHVLEHVDDKAALAQIHRVLTPGGRLFAMVPIIEGWGETYELSNVSEPAMRTLHFGQHDHVRYYGRDFRNRLRSAGFTVDEFTAAGEAVPRYGLMRGEKLFTCTKVEAKGLEF